MQQSTLELGLIQDYRRLTDTYLLKYHAKHTKEYQLMCSHPEQYDCDPNAITRQKTHVDAIEFVAKERGIDLEAE